MSERKRPGKYPGEDDIYHPYSSLRNYKKILNEAKRQLRESIERTTGQKYIHPRRKRNDRILAMMKGGIVPNRAPKPIWKATRTRKPKLTLGQKLEATQLGLSFEAYVAMKQERASTKKDSTSLQQASIPEPEYELPRVDSSQYPLELFADVIDLDHIVINDKDTHETLFVPVAEVKENYTTARSPFYSNSQWCWTDCSVIDVFRRDLICGSEQVNITLNHFKIKFRNGLVKVVRRSSVCFDNESEAGFCKRLHSACKRRKECFTFLRRRLYEDNFYHRDLLIYTMQEISDKYGTEARRKAAKSHLLHATTNVLNIVNRSMVEIFVKQRLVPHDIDSENEKNTFIRKDLSLPDSIGRLFTSSYAFCAKQRFLGVVEVVNRETDAFISFKRRYERNIKRIKQKHYASNKDLRIFLFWMVSSNLNMMTNLTCFKQHVEIKYIDAIGEYFNTFIENFSNVIKVDWYEQAGNHIIDKFSTTMGFYSEVINPKAFVLMKLVNVLMYNCLFDSLRCISRDIKFLFGTGASSACFLSGTINIIKNEARYNFIVSPSHDNVCSMYLNGYERMLLLFNSFYKLQKVLLGIKNEDSNKSLLNVSINSLKNENFEQNIVEAAVEHVKFRVDSDFKLIHASYSKTQEFLHSLLESFEVSFTKIYQNVLKTFFNSDQEDETEAVINEEEVPEFSATFDDIFLAEISKESLEIQNALDIVTLESEMLREKGIFLINYSELQTELQSILFARHLALRDWILSKQMKRCGYLENEYISILEKISKPPKNEIELINLNNLVVKIQSKLEDLSEKTSQLHRFLDFIRVTMKLSVPFHQFSSFWKLKFLPKKIESQEAEVRQEIERDKIRMIEILNQEKHEFDNHQEVISEFVSRFQGYEDYDKLDEVVSEVYATDELIQNANKKVENFNMRDKALGFPALDYPVLVKANEDFQPFKKLWTMSQDYVTLTKEWLNGLFRELNGKEVERVVTEWWTQSYRLIKTFTATSPRIAEIASKLRNDAEEFKQYVPLISSLASSAIRKRHWTLLGDLLGKEVSPDEDLTLSNLLDLDVMNIWEEVEKITVKAEKEFQLEHNINNMREEWADIEFELMEYKETKTFVLKGADDVLTLLDDHIVRVQTMLGSPFIKPIIEIAREWEGRLQYIQKLIEEILKCQRSWMYLEPIFQSDDIMRQIPTEARRFSSVDQVWRKTINAMHNSPNVIQVTNDDKIVSRFVQCNEKLEIIQKGLNDYLEIKRMSFARFFFLSNEELLEIVSQTKDPEAVQPFLNKCFEGINTVIFAKDLPEAEKDNHSDKGSLCIMKMKSNEGEIVNLSFSVDTEDDKNRGNVELWLGELELSMRITVKDILQDSMRDYPVMEDTMVNNVARKDWVLKWPGQIVLNGSQLFWTEEVSKAIDKQLLDQYCKSLDEQLLQIVHLVRGKLNKMERTTLGALSVIDLHQRDVVNEIREKSVTDSNAFEWLSQLRYYWENQDDDFKRYGKNPMNLMVRILNATQMYAYEYLGNSSRLVITPLTDRCYRTLMGAVSLLYGGAPAGPAGTGKTETTKDLAKAIAKHCVVFNCSDGLDYLAMAKFFKGLAQSGAWACFDEFNRIELEVLSVIAQQILTIVNAKRSRLKTFDFEGSTLNLNPDANCFITMNPGYAGRQELPDNLAALFRPCAMMVPDYALIAEIKLFSFGFEDARTMARKLTQVLVLCSEQLSNQKHYDYGMRAVFSILVRAGKLRQLLGDTWSEAMIVLSAVTDVNLPKFNTDDIPLFMGITRDLFPGVELPQNDYGDLIPQIRKVCAEWNLQDCPSFMRAIIQLYETVMVRHGLMVVGEALSGKSKIIEVLKEAMTRTATEMDVLMYSMNPKSITQGQLYGSFDENTHEWTDGILAVIYRNSSKDTSETRQWVMFDGPVDAVWIEDMNTVLDDNKKLCLQSGEIIKMSERMTMMFEAEDLNEASPATVSRVGMVFLEQKRLGHWPLVQSWINTLPPYLMSQDVAGEEQEIEKGHDLSKFQFLLLELYDLYFEPILFVLRNYCRLPTPITDSELCKNSLAILQSFLFPMYDDAELVSNLDHIKSLQGLFFFSLAWGIGGATDGDGRKRISFMVQRLLENGFQSEDVFVDFLSKNPTFKEKIDTLKQVSKGIKTQIPFTKGSLFDFYFDGRVGDWVDFINLTPDASIADSSLFSSILVPTKDSTKQRIIVTSLLKDNSFVLCTGDTGTGKSVLLQKILSSEMNSEESQKYTYMFLNFSAQTKANQVQNQIDGKLEKRRRGIFGPPVGKTYLVFVDDLNMPKKETYGAQPPIEILRQIIDSTGFYDLKELVFKTVVDCTFVAAMGPPGGGRNHITQRIIRHFTLLNFLPYEDDSLFLIFTTILKHYFKSFDVAITSILKKIVETSLRIYRKVSSSLLPTPAKSHYTFNLRDISKIFQGLIQADPATITDTSNLIMLWGHECNRVFSDRLINMEDRLWFDNLLEEEIKPTFNVSWHELSPQEKSLIFCDFYDPDVLIENRKYNLVQDIPSFESVMNDFLVDFNNVSTKKMDLVLFLNAIEHVTRISRVLNFEFGNLLLVGVGGSGRKSLTTLAAFICEQTLFSIEITKSYGIVEWREDLKKLLLLAGVENKRTCFLFSDTEIVYDIFVEDINNILNTGQVPNLFTTEETFTIIEGARTLAAKEGREIHAQNELLQYFVQKCRINLHVCLAFSPVGDEFRLRLRQFPSLINCCVIDWFLEWPKKALQSVAERYLKDVDVEDKVRDGIVQTCVLMQTETDLLSKRFLEEMKRYYYVTPTSYLELLKTFQTIITKRQAALIGSRNRYKNGLTKLEETAQQVADMQKDLEDLQPKLVIAQKETDEKLKNVKVKQEEADVQRSIVEKDEAAAKEKAASCERDKEECEAILSEALPTLEAAVKALKTLNKNDIIEIKAMKKPPSGVKLTMEAICRMLGVKPKKVPNPNGRGKIDDFWEPSQKVLLSDPKFLQVLMDFDKDNIDDKVIISVEKYLSLDEFQPDVIQKASKAAAGLCKWVHAIIKYDKVAKVVRPKKIALRTANDELQAALDLLKEKQNDLQEVLNNVEKLKQELNETIANKEALENQVTECSLKLDRAQRLINGLGGEKSRWTEFVEQLTIDLKNSIGDVLLSAGIIAYLGCFPKGYRESCINNWSSLLKKFKIPLTDNYSLTRTLGDPVLVRKCVINKLPNDSFSIDNSIILFNSNRYPLMIDPQGQANRWIKNFEGGTLKDDAKKDSSLLVAKPNQPDFVRILENGISFGKAVLLENVSESLDPILDTILTRQVISKGGQKTIQLGDSVVDFNDNFRFYLTTKIANPHYPPEVCVKVNLLNFMATVDGLFDQMLNITVRNETPELESSREALIIKEAENKKILKDIEDRILTLLANSQGNILDDEVLINTLSESKVTSDEIHKDIEKGEKTKVKINKARDSFKVVATKAANLFFSVADLCNIESMYQFSLDWYTQLFNLAFERADETENQSERLASLNETFARILYDNVCRSLFERDKLLFSFLLCIKCLQLVDDVDEGLFRYFLTGNTDVSLKEPNPTETDQGNGWLNDKSWADFVGLNDNPDAYVFSGISDEVKANLDFWKEVFYAQDPQKMLDTKFDSRFALMERLILLKCIRPDKVIGGLMDFIEQKIGRYFIEPPTFNLKKSFDDSTCTTPILFILTAGADPMTDLIQLGEQLGFADKMVSVSLGQGQERIANESVAMGQDKGYWVVLQNCHVAKSYLTTLERTIEEFNPETLHPDFRLFMTALPLKEFPVNILQSSIKITIEPPQGIRNNLIMSYKSLDESWFNSCDKPDAFKKMCFGICFFHALVRERISFGALGFNNKYAFSVPDLRISLDQLHLFLNSYEKIPYQMLNYLAGECNYGGRVTDDKDRRCLLTILDDFYIPDINDPEYKFSPSGNYFAPEEGNICSYLEYIQKLPLIDPPEIFGFHENAEITSAIKRTNKLLADVLSLQPNVSSKGGSSFEDTLLSLVADVAGKIPPLFDLEKATVDFPTKFEEAMNTVLTQELGRFNVLLAVIHSTLKELKKAIKGEIVMSTELEMMSISLFNSVVPEIWKKYSYPSLKPLGSWVADLVQRVKFFNMWLATKNDGFGKPKTYWLSGFYFIPGFLTGTRQNFARKYTIPIDLVKYTFTTLTKEQEASITTPAEDGAYIYGLYLEGARFDAVEQALVESIPKELFSSVPYIKMTPVKVAKEMTLKIPKAVYNCPVYKTSERWGILSTTGHSTNFVMFVQLNLKEGDKESHWIKRGVAMLTQLDV